LMSLLSPQQRADLQAAMQQAMRDAGIEEELARLQEHLGPIPQGQFEQTPGHGEEQIPLDMAMDVMGRANQMEEVETLLRAATDPDDLQGIPQEMLDNVLNEQDRDWLNQWT